MSIKNDVCYLTILCLLSFIVLNGPDPDEIFSTIVTTTCALIVFCIIVFLQKSAAQRDLVTLAIAGVSGAVFLIFSFVLPISYLIIEEIRINYNIQDPLLEKLSFGRQVLIASAVVAATGTYLIYPKFEADDKEKKK